MRVIALTAHAHVETVRTSHFEASNTQVVTQTFFARFSLFSLLASSPMVYNSF